MKEKELKELKLTKNIIIPFPNFQQNTIISPTQMNDNFEEIEHAYNNLIDNHNGAITKVNKALAEITSSDNEALTNEQFRVQAENIRVQNESERVSNEEERISEETKRIAMYNTHLNDELRREQKHTQMIGEFDLKKTELDAFIGEKEEEVQNAINSIPTKEELKGEKGDKGDRGEKGEQGERGLQGIQGIQGLKGDKGDKGEQGERGLQGIQGLKGDKGDKGDKGEKGDKGDKGDPGQNTIIDYIYEEVNSPNPSVSNSIEGSLENIQILGNTVQNPDNLADIKSVGELQEDGTYKMSILSCGKNLFNGGLESGTYQYNNGVKISSTTEIRSVRKIKVNPNSNYIISSNKPTGNIGVYYYDSKENFIKAVYDDGQKVVTTEDTHFIAFRFVNLDLDRTVQIEEGTVVTPYEPYQGNKCDILLPCQLEKVGDVSDRIYYDDVEKALCIEKNIGNITLDITKDWRFLSSNNTIWYPAKHDAKIWSQSIKSVACQIDFDSANNIVIVKDGLSSLEEYKNIMPIYVKYQLATPQKIVLPLSTQIALNSFFGTTHVYMESGEVEGTIKCKVPKSLGATVQSLNNKTDILSDRIEAIEGLKDSQNMKYETDKGYLVCKETKNGVIDDLKIEGKTLVNLANCSDVSTSVNINTTIGKSVFNFLPLIKNIENGKTYTSIITCSVSNFSSSSSGYMYSEMTYNNTDSVKKWLFSANSGKINANGTFTLIDKFSINDFKNILEYHLYSANGVVATVKLERVLLLEGDHTQNPPSYFEGLMSVGEDVDEIEVLSSNNLLEEDENYKQDKKQILFYNENGELEPVTELHEWDSIEKHSDNKWYYHKRSGKVVLNGTENWIITSSQNGSDTTLFDFDFLSKNESEVLCDKFVYCDNWNPTSNEGIKLTGQRCYIRVNTSKLSTQDVEGFKQWLQANNVTVVYQLAQEEVYELAPLHLDSYANETLILCNSGAISPKMEFSITSHINELVKSQGDRISLLEEKMYKALKQVLAGDMYSLAELLYPEDFVSKEEPIDVPTLLI